jgi:hypothetical protein
MPSAPPDNKGQGRPNNVILAAPEKSVANELRILGSSGGESQGLSMVKLPICPVYRTRLAGP